MRKLFTFILIFGGMVQGVVGQPDPVVKTIELVPPLSITHFDDYWVKTDINNTGISIQTVTLTATPSNTNSGGTAVDWNYFAGGTLGDNNPIIHQMTKDAEDNYWYSYKTVNELNRPIRPDDIYPEIFFVPSSHAYTHAPEEMSINQNNFPIFQFSNPFTMGENTGFYIEFNTRPRSLSGPPSVDLQVYLVDKRVTSETYDAFFSGDWRSSDYTALVGTVNRYDEYSHTHTIHSSHHLVALQTNASGEIVVGNKTLDVSGRFWVVLYAPTHLATRDWLLRYHSDYTPPESTNWYIRTPSSTMRQATSAPDMHVHLARSVVGNPRDGLSMKVDVAYTYQNESYQDTKTEIAYFDQTPQLPPNASSFIAPAAGTYSGDVTISWNPATDPNNDNLTYNVKLVDYTTKVLVYTAFTGQENTSVSFNTLNVPNGDYDTLVEVCDGIACTPFYWSAGQEENAKITVSNVTHSNVWVGGATGNETKWDYALNWNPGQIPDGSSAVSIPTEKNHYPVIGTFVAIDDLTIETGATVTINESGSLTLGGNLTNDAGNSGIVIKSSASGTGSLIHSTANVAGTIERYIAGWTSNLHGWHFLSAPVDGQTISTFHTAGSGNDFYKWDETVSVNPWINRTALSGGLNVSFETTFTTGKGYLMANSSASTTSFAGSVNTGNVSISNLIKTDGSQLHHGWHLLGNPFASALSWNNTEGGWNLTNINANCQIWDEVNASYATILPNGIIPAMNGFMVYTTGGGSLTIPASARTHSAQQWYKEGSVSPNHIKLIARDPAGQTAQESLIRFDAEAPGGFCMTRDSYFLEGFAPLFYSFRDEKRLSMNTLPEMHPDLVIPMGFRKNASDAFSIELVEFIDGASLYLYDKKTNKEHLLLAEHPYSFVSEAGDDAMRFEIRFKSINETTGIDAPEQFENTQIFATNNVLHVQFSESQSSRLEIYDLSGRLLLQQAMGDAQQYDQPLSLQTGVYLVRVTGKHFTRTEKIIIQ